MTTSVLRATRRNCPEISAASTEHCGMSASVRSLALYDLLAPQFVLRSASRLIDKYLSVSAIVDFRQYNETPSYIPETVHFHGDPDRNAGLLRSIPIRAAPSSISTTYVFNSAVDSAFRSSLHSLRHRNIPALAFPPSLEPLKDNVFGSIGSPAAGSDFPARRLPTGVAPQSAHVSSGVELAAGSSELRFHDFTESGLTAAHRRAGPAAAILLRYTQ